MILNFIIFGTVELRHSLTIHNHPKNAINHLNQENAMHTLRRRAVQTGIALAVMLSVPGMESYATNPRIVNVVAANMPAKSSLSPVAAPNLIVNGDAEAGPGSSDGITAAAPIPGWLETGPARANKYNIPGAFQQLADPGPSVPGQNYLAGGPDNEFSQLAQILSLNQQTEAIDNGHLRFVLSGWLGGFGDQDDYAIASVYFKDVQGQLLSEARIGPISAKQRGNISGLLYDETSALVPQRARTAEVLVQFNGAAGYNDGAADNLSLVLYDEAPAVSALPPDIYRRALRHLDSLRGSPMAPGWNASARLSSLAFPLFRPDLGDNVAYYDIPVYTSTFGIAQREATAFNPLVPAGFIVVSTGEHDFPIPHWNFEGDSPTSLLRALAQQGQFPAVRFFRMDALNYVGQDANGNKVAELGTPVNRIVNQTKFMTTTVELSSKTWSAVGDGSDVGNAPGIGLQSVQEISHTVSTTGPATGTFQLASWNSLSELKDGYAESYGTMIDSLRNQASNDWQVERTASEIGEALRKGDVYTLSLLSPTATVMLSGAGIGFMQREDFTGTTGLPIVRLTVIQDQPGEQVPFTATVSVPAEIVRFVIIPPVLRVYLPIAIRSSAGAGQAQAVESVRSRSPQSVQSNGWGPWTFFWAGNTNDQRQYGQIPANTMPNSSGCTSGCGPTAWAMLFGWADNQAALGNPAWVGRNGIYRQNGGYGGDAVAPQFRDAGVSSMTWELRQRVGTFCAFGNGPTLPWNMDSAQGYLTNRSYASVSTHYNVVGWHENRLRNYARDSIVYRRTPAIIGTGWLTHYPLAYGYAWTSRRIRRCFLWECWYDTEYAHSFYVNQGWPGASNNFGWVSAGTWFSGELRR